MKKEIAVVCVGAYFIRDAFFSRKILCVDGDRSYVSEFFGPITYRILYDFLRIVSPDDKFCYLKTVGNPMPYHDSTGRQIANVTEYELHVKYNFFYRSKQELQKK